MEHVSSCGKQLPSKLIGSSLPPYHLATADRHFFKAIQMDLTAVKKGLRLHAEAEGKYWAAEVLAVNPKKGRPVKVHFLGYHTQYDEWLRAERLRSKAIVPLKEKEVPKAPFGSTMPPFAKQLLLAKYLESAKECTDKLHWALLHESGCTRYSLPVFPEDRESDTSAYLAGILIQEMMWQRRASSSLILCGPPKICAFLQKCYSPGGAYDFDVKSMAKVSGARCKPFEVKFVKEESELPAAFGTPEVSNRDAASLHLEPGCIETVVMKESSKSEQAATTPLAAVTKFSQLPSVATWMVRNLSTPCGKTVATALPALAATTPLAAVTKLEAWRVFTVALCRDMDGAQSEHAVREDGGNNIASSDAPDLASQAKGA
ncbi:SPAC4G8.04 [Symbiodinium sp. CCMP2592]|nr:SPAC4G8.04 [Symbiodinium sp. CCMP2592]